MTLPRTDVRTMYAAHTHPTAERGNEYRILLGWPEEPAPPEGYPVVYLLDANASFGTLLEAIRMRSHRPDSTGVVPAVVVGISYPVSGVYDKVRRTYDYTPDIQNPTNGLGKKSPSTEVGFKNPGDSSGNSTPHKNPIGGLENFFHFIEQELKPAVEQDFSIDRNRQVLVGHSLGGLFVLETLFRHPEAFQSYIAISPSIWWNRDHVFTGASQLRETLATGSLTRRLLLTVGEYEQAVAPWQETLPQLDLVRQRRAERRMAGNVRDLAEALTHPPLQGLEVQHELFAGEDHASVVPLSLSRGVRFALAPATSV